MKALRRKIAAVIFSAAAIVMCLNLPAFKNKVLAGTTANGLEYVIDEETDTVTIKKYKGANAVVVIPSEIEGKKVTRINYSAFEGCSSLTSITIPASITSIEEGAFWRCSSLTSIVVDPKNTTFDSRNNCNAIINTATNELIVGCKSTVIPEEVTSIGDAAFDGCSNLTSITIPAGVKNIGESAFYGCSNLKSITIPAGVTNIQSYVFWGCSSLESITIPDKVTTIENGAFYDCSSLTSIIIPNGVTNIKDYVFEGCSSLTSIVVDKNNAKYDSRNDCNAIIDSATNELIVGCKSTVIPDGVTSIGWYAFAGSGLTGITIPDSVESISRLAFYGCSSLTSIVIPDSVEKLGDHLFQGCSALKSVTLPTNITRIKEYAFEGCSSLESITIPAKVTYIEQCAFMGCSSLKSITLPTEITTLCIATFEKCSSLESITIPNGVTSIGWDVFDGCSNLKSIKIPESVTIIGKNAFRDCDKLTIYVDAESRVNDVKALTKLEKVVYDQAVYHKHNYSNAWTTDGTSHWHKCTMCDAKKDVTAHSGGIANCTEKAKCDVCGKEYGEVKHTYSNEWKTDGTKHWHECTICGAKKDENAHKGGTATCTNKAKCDVCGKEYGKAKGHSYSKTWTSDANSHWHECTACGVKKDVTAHSGGTATCTNKAKCEVCGKEYGKTKGHSYSKTWTSDVNSHWHECTICGAKKDENAHKGGTATCTNKAKCADCGKEYGKAKGHSYSKTWTSDANSHWHKCTRCSSITGKATHTYTYVYTKATTRADGKIVKKCTVCGKVAATSVIKKPATLTTANTSYAYTGSQIKPGVTIRDSAGKTIPATEYTVTYETNKAVGKGTVKITFKGKKYSGTMTKTFNIIPKATAVTSIANGAAGITIKWSKNTTCAGYMIYRCETGAKYQRIKTIADNTVLSFTDKNVVNGKAYKYKVLPYKIIDEVNYYNNTGAGNATYRLTTPTVNAANTASGSITVKWSRNAAATGYQVVYKVGTASKTLTFTDKMIGSTVIKSLKKGSTCKIYVRSFTKNGTSTFYSGWSAVNTVKITK